MAHGNLGSAYAYLGDFGTGFRASAGVRRSRSFGDNRLLRPNLTIALGELGLLYDRQGETDKAVANLQEAYRIAKDLGKNGDAERDASNLSIALIRAAQWDAASGWNDRAYELALLNKDKAAFSFLARNRAQIAYGRGTPEEAARISCQELLSDADTTPAWAAIGELHAR